MNDSMLEELASRFREREQMLLSTVHGSEAIQELDEQIQPLVDTLVSASGSLENLASAMSAEDSDLVYAAAYVLLRMEDPRATDCVIQTLLHVPDSGKLDALCGAFCVSPTEHLPLELLLDAASEEVAAAILWTLAAKGATLTPQQIEFCMQSDSSFVRTKAWEMVALVDGDHAI